MLNTSCSCPPGGGHRHGPPDRPADHPGPAGCLGAARGGGLRRAGGRGSAPLPGYVHSVADQCDASSGEERRLMLASVTGEAGDELNVESLL